MANELKPCRSCGSKDIGIIRVQHLMSNAVGYLVLCADCGSTIGLYVDNDMRAYSDFATEEAAIEAWNTRAERTRKEVVSEND